MSKYLELVCPAGTPSALRAAVDAGADTVYCGFRDATNARNYPGLNFDPDELAEGVEYAHTRKCRVLVAVNTFPRAGDPGPWRRAIDSAAVAGADAVILADLGVLDYAATHHPKLRRHLSVQASAASPHAIRFYREAFGISRVVLPRVLSIDEVRALIGQIDIEAEVFAFGSLGTMVEGRCFISSYITGCSPSSDGACAPAAHVSYREEDGRLVTRLDDVIMNQFEADEAGAYPTPCKGRFIVRGKPMYLFEEPVALNVIPLLAQLKAAGVTALKIEGRQRSRAYVGQVVAAFRKILDAAAAGQPMPAAVDELRAVAEGGRETFSAYAKGWR
jgi:putative protease